MTNLEIWVQALLFCGVFFNSAGGFIGINIGTEVSKLPSAVDIVAILKAQKLTHVRLFDADSHMLNALSNTGIEVMVSVTNEQVLGLGESPSAAAAWVTKNVVAYVPSTNITAISVGSEVLDSIRLFCIDRSLNSSTGGFFQPPAFGPIGPSSGSSRNIVHFGTTVVVISNLFLFDMNVRNI